MASDIEVVINDAKLRQAVDDAQGIRGKLSTVTNATIASANNMSAGFRTGFYHRDHKSPAVGGTQPEYGGNVTKGPNGYVGIVHPKNYAAMKDNHLHNTMLKAIRSVGDV